MCIRDRAPALDQGFDVHAGRRAVVDHRVGIEQRAFQRVGTRQVGPRAARPHGDADTDAADVSVLSAGAVEPGLKPVLAAFERESGHRVTLSFATAPQIRERVASGAAQPDLVIAPSAVLDELAAGAKVDTAARISIGRVGIGIAVRPGGVRPDLTSADTLKRALLEACLLYTSPSPRD